MNAQLDIQLLEEQAENLTNQNNLSHASVKLRRILKHQQPKRAHLYCWLGNFDSEKEERVKVHQKYKKAFLLNEPSFPAIRYHWANILAREYRFEEAHSELKQFLKSHHSHFDALCLMATVSCRLGFFMETEEACRQVVKIKPQYYQIYEDWAAARYYQEDFDGAKKCLLKVIEADPKAFEAHRRLGYMLLTERKYREAIDCFRKAVEINNAFSLAWFNWSLALMLQNKEEEAMVKLKKGLGFCDHGGYGNRREELLEVLKFDLAFKKRYVKSGKGKQRKAGFKANVHGLKKIILLIERGDISGQNIPLKPDQNETMVDKKSCLSLKCSIF